MIRFFSYLLFLVITVASAQETSYADDAMKYLELNGTTKQYDEAVDQLFVMLKQQYSAANIPSTIWTDFEAQKPKELHKIKSLLVSAYRSSFSQEELKEMIAFYDTPAGRQLVADPTAMTDAQKDAFTLFGQTPTGQRIEQQQETLSRMVSEVSELWSRDLYKDITAQLKSKGYEL